MANAQHYAGPNKSWQEQAPNEVTREDALWVLNSGNVPTTYADTGKCPLCQSEGRPGHYPHKPDCEFVQALKVIESQSKENQ